MRETQSKAIAIWVTAALLSLAGAGCRTVPSGPVSVATFPPPPTDDVTLLAGDELDIKFYYAPELNERQVIRPDGMITLQLIGDVTAAGLAPSGLEKQLEEAFKALIDRNEISVIVRRFFGRVVYVGGAVQRPRSVEMPGNLTAMAAVMEAGGFDYDSAAPEQVLVLRHSSAGYKAYTVDLKQRFKGKAVAPFYLEPRDVLYVSRSRIADVNQWVDQYINRMIPQIGFSAREVRGKTTVGIDTSR